MGGTESVVSMGWMVVFLVILYLAGVGITSSDPVSEKKVEGTKKITYQQRKK